MAIQNLSNIANDLIKIYKFPADIATVVIERASYPDQKILRGTLSTISSLVSEEGIKSHATVCIGNVVNCLFQEEPSDIDSDSIDSSVATLCCDN